MADKRQKRVAEFIEPFRVEPGAKVSLTKDFDPAFKGGVKKKREGFALLAEGVRLLSEYQARLAAQDTWGVLVVLQALDAAGKDGTIRHVMSGVNPQGVGVHSFKVPRRRSSTMASSGVTRGASLLAVRSASLIAPITRRCLWCGFLT
jgi:polyphosphate kinase 2 (PPK2 family)